MDCNMTSVMWEMQIILCVINSGSLPKVMMDCNCKSDKSDCSWNISKPLITQSNMRTGTNFSLKYTTVQRFGISKIFFFWKRERKKQTLLFSRDALNWSKVTAKTFITLQKISVSNKRSFELYINQWTLKNKFIMVFAKNITYPTCF